MQVQSQLRVTVCQHSFVLSGTACLMAVESAIRTRQFPDVILAQLRCAQRIDFVAKRRFDARENLDRG
jgi:hypothetical protein